MNEGLIAEVARESAPTRRVLERVPADKLAWAPHAKSMTLGRLALHVATIPGALSGLMTTPVREAPQVRTPDATSVDEVLAAFETSITTATENLTSWSDADLLADWTLTRGGKALFTIPRINAVRSMMLNHWYHHRGQLTVYLRLLDVPLPSVYGPSADENPFA